MQNNCFHFCNLRLVILTVKTLKTVKRAQVFYVLKNIVSQVHKNKIK